MNDEPTRVYLAAIKKVEIFLRSVHKVVKERNSALTRFTFRPNKIHSLEMVANTEES